MPKPGDIGDRSLVYRRGMKPATQANSACYPQLDGKWVLARQRAMAVLPGWEGNRRFGVASQNKQYIYGPNGLSKADE